MIKHLNLNAGMHTILKLKPQVCVHGALLLVISLAALIARLTHSAVGPAVFAGALDDPC